MRCRGSASSLAVLGSWVQRCEGRHLDRHLVRSHDAHHRVGRFTDRCDGHQAHVSARVHRLPGRALRDGAHGEPLDCAALWIVSAGRRHCADDSGDDRGGEEILERGATLGCLFPLLRADEPRLRLRRCHIRSRSRLATPRHLGFLAIRPDLRIDQSLLAAVRTR